MQRVEASTEALRFIAQCIQLLPHISGALFCLAQAICHGAFAIIGRFNGAFERFYIFALRVLPAIQALVYLTRRSAGRTAAKKDVYSFS